MANIQVPSLGINPSQGFQPIQNNPIQNNGFGFQPFRSNTNPQNRPSNAGFQLPSGADLSSQINGGGPLDLAGAGDPGFFDKAGGSRFLVPGLEALTGVGNFFLAKDQLKLGRDQFNLARDQNTRDFNSQAQVHNTRLEAGQSNRLQNSGAFDLSTEQGQQDFDAALDAYVKENSIQSSSV